MKVSDIDKKYQESMKDYQILIDKQNNVKRDAEQLSAAAEKAAFTGDLDAYKDLKAKASDADALAYVLQKQIERIGSGNLFTPAEIESAWADYAADRNKALKAKEKKFAEAKTNLLRQYAEMITDQRETCATRERLAGYIGIDKEKAGGRFPMDHLPCIEFGEVGATSINGARIADPDAVYYLSNMRLDSRYMLENPDVQILWNVLKEHHS